MCVRPALGPRGAEVGARAHDYVLAGDGAPAGGCPWGAGKLGMSVWAGPAAGRHWGVGGEQTDCTDLETMTLAHNNPRTGR